MSDPLVGSTVLIQITVTDPVTGDPAAATVDLVIQAPDGTETTPVPTNPSVGVYQHYLALDAAGWWTAYWTATSGEYVTVKECSVCASASGLVSVSP
jgi:hypothetical protein